MVVVGAGVETVVVIVVALVLFCCLIIAAGVCRFLRQQHIHAIIPPVEPKQQTTPKITKITLLTLEVV